MSESYCFQDVCFVCSLSLVKFFFFFFLNTNSHPSLLQLPLLLPINGSTTILITP